jgi:hypothetical protein
MTMQTILGISVDAGASIDGDCPMTYSAHPSGVEIEFGSTTSSLHLGLTHEALINLIDVSTNALTDLRRVRGGIETAHETV